MPGLGWRFEVFPAACEFAVLDWRYGYVVTKERFRVERWELGHIHAMSGMRLVTSTCVVCVGMERRKLEIFGLLYYRTARSFSKPVCLRCLIVWLHDYSYEWNSSFETPWAFNTSAYLSFQNTALVTPSFITCLRYRSILCPRLGSPALGARYSRFPHLHRAI